MTGWDIINKLINSFPPIILTLILLAALIAIVIFIIGFSKHGINFIKYGFKQMILDSSLEKRFDSLEAKFDEKFFQIDARFSQIDARILAIETNHFGHLKNYLGILNGVLLDKGIIDNETKARLDNEIRGM